MGGVVAQCRQMETRVCPPMGCVDKPCARFESDDPTPWLTIEEVEAVVRSPLTAATIARLYGVPDAMAGPEAQDEALRELLSYCRDREVYKGRANEIGADTAYGDVADRLALILDGES